MQKAPDQEWLSTAELADWLGVPPDSVRYWRSVGTGPAYHKPGKNVRYHRDDVQQWLKQSRVD